MNRSLCVKSASCKGCGSIENATSTLFNIKDERKKGLNVPSQINELTTSTVKQPAYKDLKAGELLANALRSKRPLGCLKKIA